ncbi:MAG TPA: hypothetical protein VHQ00_09785 [Chloroflexota bacterium]|jgi:hypothetical protein|nr:hypothetical protein [Chloroflexota bacterium]
MMAGVDLDAIAWRVLSDLCRPGGEFGTLPPEGLQRLISLRLTEEATRNGVAPEALGEAFTRAMEELTGAGRRRQREASAESDG